MTRELDRVGDRYRMWTTVSDTYCQPPATREEMVRWLIECHGCNAEQAEEWIAGAAERKWWAKQVCGYGYWGDTEEELSLHGKCSYWCEVDEET